MTKRKTKNALLLSVFALVVCFAMLVGTTYAWFTDSVTSAGNVIKSGTLKVEFTWTDGVNNPTSADTVWTDASAGPIFNYELWEPGFVQVRHVKIENVGTLALKYQVAIQVNGDLVDPETGVNLAEVIDVYYVDPAVQVADRSALVADYKLGTLKDVLGNMNTTASGVLLAGENVHSSDTITIALKMQEEAGNEYQDLSIGAEFSIQLLAVQYTYENDSFGPDYDEEADGNPDNPVFPVNVASTTAIVNGNAATFNITSAPAAGNTQVAINGLDDVDDDDQLRLDVTTYDFQNAQAKFSVAEGSTAIAGVDLSLVDADNTAVTFDGGEATVTTYILPGLDPANVTVKYNGEGTQPTDVTYDAETGKLVFKTTHFSEYYVDYTGSWTYSPLTEKAYVGDDALFAGMRTYSQGFVTNLDKVDVDAIIEWLEDEWFGCESEEEAIWQFMLNGCNGMRPTAYDVEWQTEFVAEGTTPVEVLEMMQQYYDAYDAFVKSVKFYPVVAGTIVGWAPYPMGLSGGDF